MVSNCGIPFRGEPWRTVAQTTVALFPLRGPGHKLDTALHRDEGARPACDAKPNRRYKFGGSPSALSLAPSSLPLSTCKKSSSTSIPRGRLPAASFLFNHGVEGVCCPLGVVGSCNSSPSMAVDAQQSIQCNHSHTRQLQGWNRKRSFHAFVRRRSEGASAAHLGFKKHAFDLTPSLCCFVEGPLRCHTTLPETRAIMTTVTIPAVRTSPTTRWSPAHAETHRAEP